jgi:hypothetical protein
MELTDWARSEAESMLSPLGDRWLHTVAVADRAGAVRLMLRLDERYLLIAAAWVHDIGYAPALATSGFHPLDGAVYLDRLGRHRLACLVANHTGAREEARLRGLADELAAFPDERSILSAALVYCDLTCGPRGQKMTPDERRADIEHRHGSSSIVVAGLSAAWPELMAQVEQIEQLLAPRHAA